MITMVEAVNTPIQDVRAGDVVDYGTGSALVKSKRPYGVDGWRVYLDVYGNEAVLDMPMGTYMIVQQHDDVYRAAYVYCKAWIGSWSDVDCELFALHWSRLATPLVESGHWAKWTMSDNGTLRGAVVTWASIHDLPVN